MGKCLKNLQKPKKLEKYLKKTPEENSWKISKMIPAKIPGKKPEKILQKTWKIPNKPEKTSEKVP